MLGHYTTGAWLLLNRADETLAFVDQGSQIAVLAGVLGLEPRLTGPEPVGLPITPYPMGSARPATRAPPGEPRVKDTQTLPRPPIEAGGSEGGPRKGQTAACETGAIRRTTQPHPARDEQHQDEVDTVLGDRHGELPPGHLRDGERPLEVTEEDGDPEGQQVVEDVQGDAGLEATHEDDHEPRHQTECEAVEEQGEVLGHRVPARTALR